MGRRLNKRARSNCSDHGADGCVIVRIFFRETGLLIKNQLMDEYSIIHMSIARCITGCSIIYKIHKSGFVYNLNSPVLSTGVACWHLNQIRLSHRLGLIVIRVAMGITYTQKKD